MREGTLRKFDGMTLLLHRLSRFDNGCGLVRFALKDRCVYFILILLAMLVPFSQSYTSGEANISQSETGRDWTRRKTGERNLAA